MTVLEDLTRRTGWPIRRVGEFFEVQQGKALNTAARSTSPIHPFLRTRNINWGDVDLSDLDSMPFSESEAQRLQLRFGDLLCCEGGDIGRTAVWRGERLDCFFQNHVHRLRASSPNVNPEFVRYWLEAAFRLLGAYEGAGNNTTIPNLSAARLKRLELPVPDTQTQDRLVSLLSAIERAVKVHAKEYELRRELFDAVLLETFARGIGDSSPREWRRATLGEVAQLVSGGTPPKSDGSLWLGRIPWVSPKDMKRLHLKDAEDHISEAGAEYSRVAPAGAVLMVIRGMILARHIPVAVADVPVAFNQDMKAIIPTKEVDPLFLLYAILAERDALTKHIGTSAHGTRRLGSTAVEHLVIPVPALGEQQRIAQGLDALHTLMEVAGQGQSLFAASYDQLLAGLFSGNIAVPGSIGSGERL